MKTEPNSPVNVIYDEPNVSEDNMGLTKREHFAAMAMQGHLSNSSESDVPSTFILEQLGLPRDTKYVFMEHYPKYVGMISARYADALINALNTTTKSA